MKREVGRLIASQICIHAVMAGMRMAAPLLALDQGYSALSVGFLLALFALAQVFLAIPAGRFADTHGMKKPVRFAVLAAVVGGAIATIWPVYPILCVTATLAGAASCTAAISLQRHVGKISRDPTELRQSFSYLSIGPAISNFIGPFFAGLMIDLAGYRAAFAMLGLLPLLTLIWVAKVQDLPPTEVAADARPVHAWDMFRSKSFRRMLLVNWMMSSCWDIHTFIVPIVGHERMLSASIIGTILGSFAVAAAAIRFLIPLVAANIKEHVVLTGAMALTALVFAIYPFMTGAWGMGICSTILGLALGLVQPMIMSTLYQITPHDRHGEALGIRLMTINASSVAIPMMFGLAGAVVGVSAVFWVVGATVFAGTRAAWSLGAMSAKA